MATYNAPPKFPARSYDFTEYAPVVNYIGGTWQDSASGNWLAIENPRHGKSMGRMTLSTAQDVAAAVDDLHWTTRRPKHEVLAAVLRTGLDHLDDARQALDTTRQ